ncbi:hypothetical protein [Actinomadura chokoriensis]|uniref:hypothetical protein n=1 Tax=Actinomadura chokoriensis TaxID=454156 RepID=UPI0031F80CCB
MKTLPLVGAALLVAGLIFGFTPLSSQGTSCGSAFAPRSEQTLTPPPGDCDAVRSVTRALASALALVGAGLLVVGSVGRQRTVLGQPVDRQGDET